MQGIFNRTREPKLDVAIPTEKAKNNENETANKSKGSWRMNEKKPKNFKRTNKNIVNNMM